MSITCPNCNADNADGTRYCRRCGINLGDAAPKDRGGHPVYASANSQAGQAPLTRPLSRPGWMGGWRYDLLANVHGRVLEIGVRDGLNFRYYLPDSAVAATDFSHKVIGRARRLFPHFRQGRLLGQVDAQHLPFADGSFDAVVATLVLCSIPDPLLALQEIARVLRPGGRLYTIDHVRSDRPRAGALMDTLAPLYRALSGECNLNRRTDETIRGAGYTVLEQRAAVLGIFRWLISVPPRQAGEPG